MNTEIRDKHFAAYADSVAAHISWPAPASHLTRWKAFVGTVITGLSARKRAGSIAARALAVVLCIAAFGCAGLGMQNASSLTPQLSAEHGLDGLWMSAGPKTTGGMRLPRHASGNLGLWDSVSGQIAPSADQTPAEKRTTSDVKSSVQ